jgi:FMN phosphatase YigB (HAD superfamily)
MTPSGPYERIAFDLDDTLYRNPSFSDALTELTKRWLVDELDLDRDRVEALYGWLPSAHPNPYDGFTSLGLAVDDYFENVFHRVEPRDAIQPRPELERACSELDPTLVVVSLAPREHCERVLSALGIDDHVEAIYNPYQDADAHEKDAIYTSFTGERTLVVGDSYHNDLRPAAELGIDTVHVAPDCDLSHRHDCTDDVLDVASRLSAPTEER